MNKFTKAILLSTLTLEIPAVFAIDVPNTPPNGAPNLALPAFITRISDIFLSIIGVIAVMFIVVAGFQYVTSAGNPDQITKAKNTALYAIMGIIVALIAWAVIKFIADSFN
ncbi:hypothetical protein HGB13_01090 [bacterium]|nr:hypothetical protein [bacterium]